MKISNRIKFFLGHLSVSVVIALIIIGVIFFLWYPAPFAYAEGVTKIFLMLLAIDIIIGPLLTLLIYKEGKKTLKMDLSVIILMQCIALSYGIYSITQSRPVWIVQNGWLFELVRANAVDVESQKLAKAPYHSNSLLMPKWVAVDVNNHSKNINSDPTFMPNFYTELASAKVRIQEFALPLDELYKFNNESKVNEILQNYPEAVKWMPLRTTGLGLVVLLNQQYEVIATVNLRPWKE